MLGLCLKILSILGMILLAALAVMAVILLLVLFFPVTYRISGAKDGEGLRLTVKVNWLFGLFRVRFRYPDPGRLKVKALFFSLFDKKISSGEEEEPEDGKAKKEDTGKEKKRRRGSEGGSKTAEEQSDRAGDREKEPGSEGSGGRIACESAGRRKQGGTDRKERNRPDSEERDRTGNEEQAGTGRKEQNRTTSEEQGGTDSEEQTSAGKERQNGEEEEEKSRASGTRDAESGMEDTGSSGEDISRPPEEDGWGGKISGKVQKIVYTIRNIYDKIKKIWENISYYMELLQEEDTKQLFSHALCRGGKILKSIRPRYIKADILFGTGSPDTTGYAYGMYCAASSLLGTGFWVTPDFERKILEGHFEAVGHVTIWIFVLNGVKLLLDRRLRALLGKVKAGPGKVPA